MLDSTEYYDKLPMTTKKTSPSSLPVAPLVLQLALETLPQKVAPTRLSHQVDDKSFPTEQSLAKTGVAGNLGMPIIGANKTSVKHFLSSRKLLVSHTSY